MVFFLLTAPVRPVEPYRGLAITIALPVACFPPLMPLHVPRHKRRKRLAPLVPSGFGIEQLDGQCGQKLPSCAVLSQNSLYEEGGMLEEALQHLDRSEPMIVDKLFYYEKKAALLIKLGREAELLLPHS